MFCDGSVSIILCYGSTLLGFSKSLSSVPPGSSCSLQQQRRPGGCLPLVKWDAACRRKSLSYSIPVQVIWNNIITGCD
jgi:hypothetical protein